MKTTNSLPKYWVVQCNTYNPNWRKVIDYLHNVHGQIWGGDLDGSYYGYDGGLSCWNGTNVYSTISHFQNSPTLLTIEEFVEMTESQTNKPKETMKTITHTQAQSIIDIACREWKERLFELWGKDIVMKKSIGISDTYYQAMRKACTHEQHQLFDEIFGKDEPAFKIGDWIMFEGNYGNAGPYQIKSFRNDGVALDQNGEVRDVQSQYRLATEDELKPKFKVGDWIVPLKPLKTYQGHGRGNGAYEIYDVELKGVRTYNEVGKKDGNGFLLFDEIRPATEEEIQKAKYIPEGTPCLVRDSNNDMWKLTYSLGNGKFQSISGVELSWIQVQVLDINNLPKY